MSLRCLNKQCMNSELARGDQLAFYQDINTGGWNLGLGPEFDLEQSKLPPDIRLIESGDPRLPYTAVCNRCHSKIGKANVINGFERLTVNFSAKNTILLESRTSVPSSSSSKWAKIILSHPQIRKIRANVAQGAPLVGSNTVHFHGLNELQEMIQAGNAVAARSGLAPRRYQWRAYFMACLQNVLLCLPTGMGKTLIAVMLVKAYKQLNPGKGQVLVVPTIVLVEQQSVVIERFTGLKVQRRSGEHKADASWSASDISVCTAGMLNNAVKMKKIDVSQLSLLIFDEVHEANSQHSDYGLLLPLITKCAATQRPRVLGLTASPSGAETDLQQAIVSLCSRLDAVPFSPILDDDKNTDKENDIKCDYVEIHKSPFQLRFETFVFDSVASLVQLHNFFEANWKEIPANVDVKVKTDAVLKILSHSRLVAHNTNDLALMQLTQVMNKWLDALDMLQIFGPRKLIDFIRADIAFVAKEDSVSALSSRLHPMLFTFTSKLNQMENEHHVTIDSPRVAALLSQLLLHQDDQERILIFVDRRNTAERLCRRLKDHPIVGNMNPEYVIGNANGGFPKELQQEVMEKFHNGECQVLVATSVLEQGIDVAACGVVICFDGIKSVKSIIQSRGRARKSSSKFIAFVTSDGRRRVNELTGMEVAMGFAIQQLMLKYNVRFDPHFDQEIEKFLNVGHDDLAGAASDDVHDESDGQPDDDELDGQLMFKLRFFNFNNGKALAEHIRSFTSKYSHVKVSKKSIHAQFAVDEMATDGAKIIKNISTPPDTKSSSWFEFLIPIAEMTTKKLSGHLCVSFDNLTGFHFVNCCTVNLDTNVIWNGKFTFHIQKNEIVLSHDGSARFFIHPINVEGPILVNDTNSCFEIYLCLRNPPRYVYDDDQHRFDFHNRSFNLRLKRSKPIDPSVIWMLRNSLQSFSLDVHNVCNLKQVPYVNPATEVGDSFTKDILIKAWFSKHAGALPPTLPAAIVRKFNECSSTTVLQLLLDVFVPARFQQLVVPDIKQMELPFSDTELPSNYAMFGRVKVTPSRFIFQPMLPMTKHRVFRFFPNPENFLVVSFTEEHGSNPWRNSDVCDYFLSVMKNGIAVGGKVYNFLGCSNSQLREGHCWFSCLDRKVVYDMIGEFPISVPPGRKLTRLALAFASCIETVPLDHARYLAEVAPDIEVGKICFSDGIGTASQSLFKRVRQMLNLPQDVSALQIRVGGVKGVISIHDTQVEDVKFRQSMKKFESSHNMLEVLNYSRSTSLYLNRHVVLLLASYGVPVEAFLELQYNELTKCMDALTNERQSLAFVQERSKIFDWELLVTSHIAQEPFYRLLLVSNSIELVSKIVDHAHICVPDGRILMGVLDETNTLDYGEVYAHIVEDDVDVELEGKVLVFRNPCVLPSDIRLLNARRQNVSPRLKQMYRNCLVIPSHGVDSHARECAGGDLDGDLYYVIWDRKLIPPGMEVPGMKVVEVETNQPPIALPQFGTTDEDMMQFFCNYLSSNQLGIIANAHLATGDMLGMFDPKTVELARYVTAETDAPKKGLTVGPLPVDLLPMEYPDYMQKHDKATYRSETALGELFRQAAPILEVLLEKKIASAPISRLNIRKDLGNIENFYLQYSFEINKLLQSFELESEVDLFSGSPMWRKGYMSLFKQQTRLRETVHEIVAEFWQKWKEIFRKWLLRVSSDQKQILEWYNRPKSCKWPAHSFSLLALPYIDFDANDRISISDSIKESTTRWIHDNKMMWLGEWRARQHAGLAIMRKLEGTECHFYGSSMLGLSEEYSDLDLYAADSNLQNLSEILKVVDGKAASKTKPHACVSLTFDSLAVDVTNFIGGVRKTYALAEAFDVHHGFWPALRVLVEWARTVRIVKSGGSQGLMTVVSFCHLFIYFATSEAPKTTFELKPYSLSRFSGWMENLLDLPIGSLIYDFLKMLSNRSNKAWIASKTDPLNGERLINSGLIEDLCKYAEIAIYILAVHEGNVRKLFEFCSKKRLFRLNKRYMSPATASEAHRAQNMKEIRAKCNPTCCENLTFELLERNGLFFLEVSGDHKHFQDVERGLNRIIGRIFSARTRGQRNSFHVVNSSMIIPEFGYGKSTEVSFATYQSDQYMPQHTGLWKSVLKLRISTKNLIWRSHEYDRYRNRFMDQMKLFKSKQQTAKPGARAWRFFGDLLCNIRCGNHYLFNIPTTLINTFETITLGQVERNIAKLEETLAMEEQRNIIREQLNYNSHTLLQPQVDVTKHAPVSLMPLTEAKKRSAGERGKVGQITEVKTKKSNGVSHSFYPHWALGLDKAKEFAMRNGFAEVQTKLEDFYTTISIHWRQRELVIHADGIGMIQNIRHRSTRWLSCTFKQFEDNGGDDVRIYLETRAALDDDETCLETVIDYMEGRSVFRQDYMQQVQQSDAGDTDIEFSTTPLIAEMFHLNWRFRSMRRITPVLKFANADGDVLLLHAIHDGIFRIETHDFEWFPKHFEFEIRMNVSKRSHHELCEKAFEMSQKLFDFTKSE